jgi:hypothetical protein
MASCGGQSVAPTTTTTVGTVPGVFGKEGGPASCFIPSEGGTVTLTSDQGVYTATVSSRGDFAVDVPPGTYILAADNLSKTTALASRSQYGPRRPPS